MNNFRIYRMNKWICITFFSFLIFSTQIYAELLDSWSDERAYKPPPILFLHGFGQGSPQSWNYLARQFQSLYSSYQQIGPFMGNNGTQYLEIMHFIDSNGSVDGPGGWTDQLDHTVTNLLGSDKYGAYTDKIIIIAHSMGGLAAEDYITSGGEDNVLKLITIDTPHAGSPLANFPRNIVKSRTAALFIPVIGWSYASSITTVRSQVAALIGVDISGEAIRDLSIGSPFLTELANRVSPQSENFIYGISSCLESRFNQCFFWQYYPNSRTALVPKYAGDRVVPIDSQEGWDVYTDEGKRNPIEVWHMDEVKRINGPDHTSILQNQEVYQQILEWIDSETPEIEITEVKETNDGMEVDVPLQGDTYILQNTKKCILIGTVKKEFLPASSNLIVSIRHEGEEQYNEVFNENILKPDDSWNSNNPESIVAAFKKEVTFPESGKYTINIKIENLAGISSNDLVIKVEVKKIYYINNYSSASGWAEDVEVYDNDPDFDGVSEASAQVSLASFRSSTDLDSMMCSGHSNATRADNAQTASAGAQSYFRKYYEVVSTNGIGEDIGNNALFTVNCTLTGQVTRGLTHENPTYGDPTDPNYSDIREESCSMILMRITINKDYREVARIAPPDYTYFVGGGGPLSLNINDSKTVDFIAPIGSVVSIDQFLRCEVNIYSYGTFAESHGEIVTELISADSKGILVEL